MLQPLPPDDARRLREFLVVSRYGREGLRELLITDELASYRSSTLPRLRARTKPVSRLHTLARWFAAGLEVETAIARQWIPDWAVELCLQSGLLAAEGHSLVPQVMLAPFENLLLATDLALKICTASTPDVVLGINRTTLLLHRFTIRKPCQAALDLGAGCGVQSLMAASHSRTVVATDLNARASQFAAFNAQFNGFENVECLTGDAFAPVSGRRFDLIVANPPFFISPSRRHLFCDNDMDLDQFCRRLVREAPARLEEGGYLQMILEWAQIRGQPWPERLAEWFEGTGCDAWVFKSVTFDPSEYAMDCIQQTMSSDPKGQAAGFDQWMAYYQEREVQAIHAGMIAMRRRPGPNWLYIEELPSRLAEPVGDAILQGFARRDYLQTHGSDEQLLAARLRISPDAQLDQQMRPGGGRWRLAAVRLHLVSGLRDSENLDPLVAEFISGFDGSAPLDDLVRRMAAQTKADVTLVQQECLRVVRGLIRRGFVVPESLAR